MIKRLLIAILLCTTAIISAQKNNSSPYSYFGIGGSSTLKTVEQSSMGGIGVAMKNMNYLNFINPAAYADLRYATYGIGGKTTFLTLKDAKASQFGNSTSLRYIALAFPLGKKAGFSAGLQPLSSVGYSLLDEKFSGGKLQERTRYFGKGGTNRLYGSYGMYLFKGFSVGLEGAFIFGNIERSILSQKLGVALNTKYKEKSNIKGSEFKVGAQYKTNIGNKLALNAGVAVRLSTNLNKKGTESLYSLVLSNNGTEVPVDVLYTNSISTPVVLPVRTTMGLGLGKENKWYIEANSEFKKAPSLQLVQGAYKTQDAFKTSVGGFYIPKINSISSYWKRVTYRAGMRYENTGLLVNVNGKTASNFTPIKDFGINVGIGLPLPRQISNLNIGLEYGQKGTTNNNLIKEEYFNVRLSLSLNALNWFKKRQID